MISCDNVIIGPDMYGCPPVEYGTPFVEFTVVGQVVDADSNPIPNIKVSHDKWPESVRTSEDGTFELNAELNGFEMESATLDFTDTDGEENGGEFMSQTVDIPLVRTEQGDGNWDNGEFSASDVEIVLNRKSASE